MNNIIKKTAEKGSVRNIILIFIAILLVGGSFAFAQYRNDNKQSIYTASDTVNINSTGTESHNIDTDGDGLKDWEEILVGSNPRDAKSKGEVSKKTPLDNDLTIKKENLTSTDILSRDFFARYMELRQIGASGDKLSQEDAVSQSVGTLAFPQPKVYTTANIYTDSTIGKEAVRIYVNKIGTIFKTYIISSRNEAAIVKESTDKENPKILEELDPIIASYKKVLTGLIKIPVPSSMTQMHLDIINSLSGVIFINELFRKSATDPVLGLQAAGSYLRYAGKFNISYNNIRSYITFLGITYMEQEGGSFFQPKT